MKEGATCRRLLVPSEARQVLASAINLDRTLRRSSDMDRELRDSVSLDESETQRGWC